VSVHLIANVGDRHAICGHDLRRDKRAAWCWEPHALAHIDGHNMAICADCAGAMTACGPDELDEVQP
jgi:hypothetical protein